MDTRRLNYSVEIMGIDSKIKNLDSYDVVFLASDYSTVQNKIAILSMNRLSTKCYMEFAEKSLSLYEKILF
jgi:hypothetical protein